MRGALSAAVGAKVVRGIKPQVVGDYARWLASSFDELWIVEDCFYAGGISQLSIVLDASGDVPVGHGIAPAPFRNAAALAMEWATFANVYPGRLLCGLGHGVPAWMRQIGAEPESPMTMLFETAVCVDRLLRGESVSFSGHVVQLENVALEFPPQNVPPISLGVRGPKSLRLAGEISDGAVLAEWSSPGYVEWARRHLDEGRSEARRSDPYRLTAFVGFCFADDPEAVAATEASAEDLLSQQGMRNMIWPDDATRPARPSAAQAMDAGLAVGSAEDIASYLVAMSESGADALIMEPMGPLIGQFERFIDEVLPLLN